jgi:alpha-glucosidase
MADFGYDALTMYHDEELGMTNVAIPPHEVRDPAEKNQPGIGMGRDPERTPNAVGQFPSGRLHNRQTDLAPLGPDHRLVNVENLGGKKDSILSLYRELIRLRHTHPSLWKEPCDRSLPRIIYYVSSVSAEGSNYSFC